MIPKEILKKYNMVEFKEYKKLFDETENAKKIFYETFLIKTDHIPNKIIEAQALGNTPEDYTEILNYRQFAREQINRLANV